MTRLPFKRAVAALLPFCFLWAFAACVSLCAEESKETGNDSSSMLCLESEDATTSDSCSIVETTKAALRDRLPLPTDDVVMQAGFASALACVGLSPRNPYKHSSNDPPFERLSVLRI